MESTTEKVAKALALMSTDYSRWASIEDVPEQLMLSALEILRDCAAQTRNFWWASNAHINEHSCYLHGFAMQLDAATAPVPVRAISEEKFLHGVALLQLPPSTWRPDRRSPAREPLTHHSLLTHAARVQEALALAAPASDTLARDVRLRLANLLGGGGGGGGARPLPVDRAVGAAATELGAQASGAFVGVYTTREALASTGGVVSDRVWIASAAQPSRLTLEFVQRMKSCADLFGDDDGGGGGARKAPGGALLAAQLRSQAYVRTVDAVQLHRRRVLHDIWSGLDCQMSDALVSSHPMESNVFTTNIGPDAFLVRESAHQFSHIAFFTRKEMSINVLSGTTLAALPCNHGPLVRLHSPLGGLSVLTASASMSARNALTLPPAFVHDAHHAQRLVMPAEFKGLARARVPPVLAVGDGHGHTARARPMLQAAAAAADTLVASPRGADAAHARAAAYEVCTPAAFDQELARVNLHSCREHRLVPAAVLLA